MALLGLSKVGTWVTLPPRGIGIILLSIIAGFSVASLILKPWSKMTNWSEINQSSYRVAMEDGMMGSTGSIGSGLKKDQDIPLHPHFCCWLHYATFISIGNQQTNKILRMCHRFSKIGEQSFFKRQPKKYHPSLTDRNFQVHRLVISPMEALLWGMNQLLPLQHFQFPQ